MIDKAKEWFKGNGKDKKDREDGEEEDLRTKEEKERDLDFAKEEVLEGLKNNLYTLDDIDPVLEKIRQKYRLKELTVV